MDPTLQDLIEQIGSEHVERRLKIEVEHEAQLFGQGLIFFNLENWYAAPWIVRTALKLTGLYGRARRNADHVVVKKHSVAFANLPPGPLDNLNLDEIDWAIAGGESGPAARPMNPDWVRSIRDQCVAAGVAFHFKQWGGVQKKQTGRMLDGRTWDELPTGKRSLATA